MKLGRPGEALLAWQKTLELDTTFASHFNKRKKEMKFATSPTRWLQALAQSEGGEWACPDNISHRSVITHSDSTTLASPSYSKPISLFASPIEVINITAFRESRNLGPLDHTSLVEAAFRGYQEANWDGPLVDEVHGELTPNNQFFEYQMSLLNQATSEDLKSVMVGWSELRNLAAWKELVETVRSALVDSTTFSPFLPIKTRCTTQQQQQQLLESVSKSNSDQCELVEEHSVEGYGWISMHKEASTHVKHAHLDARLSLVYYVQLPEPQSMHKIVFYDPRGLSPHQNLRLANDVIAPPFTEVYSHFPKPGDLVIFPSWLVHEVLPVEVEEKGDHNVNAYQQQRAARESLKKDDSNMYRVSISFNIGEGWEGSAPALI
jgi:uncharacterized protein (TIGR02466 family)